jgi:tRNA 2-selenouridine synthase
MPEILTAADFLNVPHILLDTRSPGEYEQGHIPGAVSFPLFSNEERAKIGTCYKQIGKEEAIELGLEIIAPKMVEFVRSAKQLASDKRVRVHCWRGGMRSSSMAWLLETAGMQVTLLEGGYKAFRKWVRSTLSSPRKIITLGGMTGTGKTQLLHALANQSEQILDLEALANHRGSSYGALGLPAQPTVEHFENLIAMQWMKLDPNRPVWIEAESRRVGLCRIPDEILTQMMQAPVIQIERSRQERIQLLIEEYGKVDREELIIATERISRKLGGQHAQRAIEYIRQGNLEPAIDIVLNYYDKTYWYDLQRRNVEIHSIEVTGRSEPDSVAMLIETSRQVLKKPIPGFIKQLTPIQ